jgi:hypothetical protein
MKNMTKEPVPEVRELPRVKKEFLAPVYEENFEPIYFEELHPTPVEEFDARAHFRRSFEQTLALLWAAIYQVARTFRRRSRPRSK